jgi:hypothetical protein
LQTPFLSALICVYRRQNALSLWPPSEEQA